MSDPISTHPPSRQLFEDVRCGEVLVCAGFRRHVMGITQQGNLLNVTLGRDIYKFDVFVVPPPLFKQCKCDKKTF